MPSTTGDARRRRDGGSTARSRSCRGGTTAAAAILVPARTGETTCGVFLVDPHAAGRDARERETTVTGEPQSTVRLDGVRRGRGRCSAAREQGAEIVAWTSDAPRRGLCATQTGVCEEACAITARYVCEREQFGTKIGTFQAVGQRIADAYIDTEAIRLTATPGGLAAGRGRGPADEELMTAKFWAADGGHRVVHAAQHLHGGIGVDLDYPIHRYFRWAKARSSSRSAAPRVHLRLGARIAAARASRRRAGHDAAR